MCFSRCGLAAFAVLALALAACSAAPSHQASVQSSEIARMNALKARYPSIVMGFDVHGGTTLVLSIDLQTYIGTDDDTIDRLKRDALADWRAAWLSQHPHEHAIVQVRFIDFIGRKVAEESARI